MEDIRMKLDKISSKEMYKTLSRNKKDTLPVITMHYKEGSASIWENCGLIRVKEIKRNATKVFSMRYNRIELLKLTLSSI